MERGESKEKESKRGRGGPAEFGELCLGCGRAARSACGGEEASVTSGREFKIKKIERE